MKHDDVENPAHYNQNGIEVIDVIETYAKTDFRLANVIKYVCRCDYKGTKLQDLQKAAWYLDRVIEELEDVEDVAAAEDEETFSFDEALAFMQGYDYAAEQVLKGEPLYDPPLADWSVCDAIDRLDGFGDVDALDEERDGYPGTPAQHHEDFCKAQEANTITAEELMREIEEEDELLTHEEAMTSPGLCPFIDIEGYVHGVQCGCAVMDPTVTNWPGATTPPETFVHLPTQGRVGGQEAPHIYAEYYGFNPDEIVDYCAHCHASLTQSDVFPCTSTGLSFCDSDCQSYYFDTETP